MKLNKLFIAACLSAGCFQLSASEAIEPILVTIPSGSFQMGSHEDKEAQPVHKVTLPEFSMGKYEVTVQEFRRFIDATNYKMPSQCYHELNGWFNYGATDGTWENNSLNTSEYQPVNCVGWDAANAYVAWLAKETGKPYRLPSEAEWEYAARAGTTTTYYFGDDPDLTKVCEFENTADLSGENILQRDSNTSYVNFYNGKSNCADHSGYASIVGMYKPNAFGLHDMLSNMMEFIADCYRPNYDNAPTDGKAVEDKKCERRGVRGSSWHWNIFEITRRGGIGTDFVGGVEGFRVALDGSAPNMSVATQHFSKELKTAQRSEQMRRDAKLPYPKPVKNLTIKQENGIATLSWDKSTEENIDGYRIYRNASVGSTFDLYATNLVDTAFRDANVDPLKYEYTVVAVRRHQQSDYSKTVTTEAPIVSVPGRLEAESATELKGTSVARTSDVDGRFNLTGPGGISDDAVIDYQLNVKKSGNYNFSYRVAAPRDGKGFTVLINDIETQTKEVAKTGGYHEWQTQKGGTVYLKKGKNKLTIKSHDKNWKLNWVAIEKS